jgi:CubicO group peptidase (beta-lactamase class C family)
LDKALKNDELAGVRSVLVVVAGRTAYEKYPESDAQSYHHVMSVTKSVIGALIGIAIAQGKISGVDATLSELLPKYAPMMSKETAAVTLEQLLTMTGGFGDQATEAREGEDWVGRIIAKGGIKPGHWVYSNDGPHLLSAALTAATGMSALDYARTVLFAPLGISSEPADEPVALPHDLAQQEPGFGWARDPQGVSTGSYGLRLRAWDMAKIGLLYLAGGRWDGQQVVPASWVKQSTRSLAQTDFGDGYGYLWWADFEPEQEPVFTALGSGGQRIVVAPERDLVVVVQVDQAQTLGVSESEADQAVNTLLYQVGRTYPRNK